MNYKGIELVEVTKDQLFDRPKWMLVWDESYGIPVQREVCAIVSSASEYRVICKNSTWKHCAEIPEPNLATYRELSRWLAEGKGEVTEGVADSRGTGPYCSFNLYYSASDSNKAVENYIRVRKWDDTEWHSVTREYLGLDGE